MIDEPEAAVVADVADDSPSKEGNASEGSTSPARPRRRRGSRGGRGRKRPSGEATTTGGSAPTASEEKAVDTAPSEKAEPSSDEPKPKSTRRRRRGGRRHRKKPVSAATAETASGDQPEQADDQGDSGEQKDTDKPSEAKPAARKRTTTRRRRRTRPSEAKPKEEKDQARPRRERKERAAPTRLAARAAARARSPRRRREMPIVVPRVRDKLMVITEHGDRDQLAVLEDRDLVQHYITRTGTRSMVGNIYKARVQNVLPGMEAAFLDIGRGRNAVLYAGEVNYDEDVEADAQRIEQVLKSGQSVLVQVTKDPMGGKGARLTAQISIPGRYLVLVPNSQMFGISRRLPDNERRRLRTAVKEVRPEKHGVIVRTAADGASKDDLAADVERLVKEWDEIEKKSKKAKAPAQVYEEPELTVRVVRDLFNAEEFKELVTDSSGIYERVVAYLQNVAPDLVDKVKLHEGSLPVFEEYHVIEQIHKALDRKVWLPSGGYIVIERTEALTVIDVNTGKHVGKHNLEETVVKTNIEAAQEVAKQLRLRDIGGMIIVDFIDMLLETNKKQIVDTMREALAQDKTRSQVFDISPLGLLEITRKRVSAGLLESFSETCPTCEGRGILLTLEV
ncbi:MAG: Rne/Rng family ribonuclease [Actinomycetota bacterium]